MSNPFAQIRAALKAALKTVAGADWADTYNGEDWKDEDCKLMARRIADDGNGIYIRIPKTALEDDPSPRLDENGVFIQLIAAAGAIDDRATAAEAAEELVYQAYAKARKTETGMPQCFHLPLQLIGFAIEFQSPTATIISCMLHAPLDFGVWKEEDVR